MARLAFDLRDLDLLFRLLWEVPKPRGTEQKLMVAGGSRRFRATIPDTVLFQKGLPRKWYFTDSEGESPHPSSPKVGF